MSIFQGRRNQLTPMSHTQAAAPGGRPLVPVAAGELAVIAAHTAQYPSIETGGDIFGLWTQSGMPVPLFITGPGPQAGHHFTSFFQDPDFLDDCARRLYERFGIQHIGEWHSHHRLGLAEPSGGDITTVQRGLANRGWHRFLLVIANIERDHVGLGFFLFRPDEQHEPVECDVAPTTGPSPMRVVAPDVPAGEPPLPEQASSCWRLRRPRQFSSLQPVARGSWYGLPEMQQRLVSEIRALEALRASTGTGFQVRPSGNAVVVTLTRPGLDAMTWTLLAGFPRRPPLVESCGRVLEPDWDEHRLISDHLDGWPVAAGAPADAGETDNPTGLPVSGSTEVIPVGVPPDVKREPGTSPDALASAASPVPCSPIADERESGSVSAADIRASTSSDAASDRSST
jgi:hypothetical protein